MGASLSLYFVCGVSGQESWGGLQNGSGIVAGGVCGGVSGRDGCGQDCCEVSGVGILR